MIETRMSRARLFVLVEAFEHDLRDLVDKYVLDHVDEADALGKDFERASDMRLADAGDHTVSIVHYLFLQQSYDLLNRYRRDLPSDIGDELRENTSNMPSLVAIRNRVMHGRPLKADDPESAVSYLQCFTSRYLTAVSYDGCITRAGSGSRGFHDVMTRRCRSERQRVDGG